MSITLIVSLLWITHLTVFTQEVPESDNTPASTDATSTTETPSEELPYKLGEILIQYDETSFTSLVSEDESGSVEVPGGLLDTVDTAPAPIGVVNEFLQANGVQNPRVIQRITSLNVELVSIGEGMDPLTIIDRLKASPVEGVVLAQPNFIYQSLQSSSTTGPDTRQNDAWHLKAIQLKDAWDFVADNPHTDTGTVTIGVIDRGVDFTDTDLTNKKWTSTTCVDNAGATVTGGCPHGGYDVYTNPHDNNPEPKQTNGTTDPYNTHGTEVASILAGEYNNTYGTVGVAQSVGTDSAGALTFGHAIKIVGIRFGENLPPTTPGGRSIPKGTSAEIIEGIDFARRNDIDIINLSLGMQLEPNSCGAFKYTLNPLPRPRTSQWLVYQALENYGSGDNGRERGLAIIAAGNDFVESGGHKTGKDNNTIVFPADFASTVRMKNSLGFTTECWSELANVISVGGTELNSQGDEEIWYSHYDTVESKEGGTSYGDHITITAPAQSIPTSLDVSAGTSFAAPQVAGVAALMLRVQPDLEPLAIKTRIKQSADELPNLRNTSVTTQMSGIKTVNLAKGRRLNAYRAVVAALGQSTTQISPLPTISNTTNPLTTSLLPVSPTNVISTPGNGKLTISWDAVPNANTYEIRWRAAGRDTTLTAWDNIGAVTEKTITRLTNGTRYVVQVRGVNSAGKGDKAVITFSKSTTPKAAPLSAPTNVTSTPGGGHLTISWNAVSNADSYEIRWRSSGPKPNPWNYTNVGNVRTYTITGLTNGTRYAIHLRAKNSAGVSEKIIINFGKRTKPAKLKPTGGTDSDGDGLIDIVTVEQLNNMRYNLYGTSYKTSDSAAGVTTGCPSNYCKGYELLNDLDFAGSRFTAGSGWDSIGDNDGTFHATFEGNGHTISNLTINTASEEFLGLFGRIGSNAHISNITFNRANITGIPVPGEDFDRIGALAGLVYGNNVIIDNVAVTNSRVTGIGMSLVGGLAGTLSKCTVRNSSVRNSVITVRDSAGGATGASHELFDVGVGGFTGAVGEDTVISDSSAQNNTVRAESIYVRTGGFAGNVNGTVTTSSVTDSTISTTSSRTRSFRTGGFVGLLTHGTLENVYVSGGSVTSTGSVGGLVGAVGAEPTVPDISYHSQITNSYSDTNVGNGNGIYAAIHENATLTLTNTYYNKEKATATPLQQGAKTGTQLRSGTPTPTIYTNWSTDIWNFDTTTELPTLR